MPKERSLSSQESRVLKLLCHNDNEIAFQLCIATSSVKTYVQRILIKLGVNNRTAAVILAIKKRIVRVDDFKLDL